jgi:hypothetical protein
LFERLADRSQLVLLAASPWPETKQALTRLWNDPDTEEHAFYPLSWFKLTAARQRIASAYGEGKVKLFLSADPHDPASSMLMSWLEALIPGFPSPDFEDLELDRSGTQIELLWNERREALPLESCVAAVRAALDRPHRDPVFKKIIEQWSEPTS